MRQDVVRIGVEHESTAWLRWQTQTVETRRTDLVFDQCGHLTPPTFNGRVVLWDPEMWVCADCICVVAKECDTAFFDRCGASDALHHCLTCGTHTRFAFALCPYCLEKELR